MSISEAPYVVDVQGEVWAVVRDGGMLTRATYDGVISVGIVRHEKDAGPLLPLYPMQYRSTYPRAERP